MQTHPPRPLNVKPLYKEQTTNESRPIWDGTRKFVDRDFILGKNAANWCLEDFPTGKTPQGILRSAFLSLLIIFNDKQEKSQNATGKRQRP